MLGDRGGGFDRQRRLPREDFATGISGESIWQGQEVGQVANCPTLSFWNGTKVRKSTKKPREAVLHEEETE